MLNGRSRPYLALLTAETHSARIRARSQVWDMTTSTVTRTLVGHQFTVWSLVAHPETGRLFSASADNTIKVWDTTSTATKCISSVNAHAGRVYSLTIHGDRLFSAASDRTVKVRQPREAARLQRKDH